MDPDTRAAVAMVGIAPDQLQADFAAQVDTTREQATDPGRAHLGAPEIAQVRPA
ncbi:MAG: hypothetical protein AAFU49_05490 [Pseudomonadota bacterium]